ncbi:MAG: hypothetical protein HY653_05370, partial [Acidobacteria bacterium]|nr:hypothetical protein [Acidobacteriota bacterium]
EVTPAGTRRLEITAPDITRALRLARELPAIRSATVFGQSIHAVVEESIRTEELEAQLARQGVVVLDIRPLAPSLEDVFVELTRLRQPEVEVAHD